MGKPGWLDNRLHILLIPPVINPVTSDQGTDFIPVGLLVLLSTLEQSGFRALIYKPCRRIAEDGDIPEVAGDMLSRDPVAIGFSTWCDSFPISLLLAEEIKRRDPSVHIIFGGPQASVLANEILLKFPFIDFILRGEADHSLPRLISRLVNGNEEDAASIPGLVGRDRLTGEVDTSLTGDIVKDLDQLPIPAYGKLMNKNKVRIDAGRGCPYSCTYCSTSQFFSKRYRVKSPGRILAEMEYCHRELGITRMGISHDMFTLDKAFMADFTRQLRARNKHSEPPLTWTCSARTDCVDEQMLEEMRKSGCRAIFFGIESGSDRIQKEIRKNLDLRGAIRMIRHSAALGITTIASFMAGFPGETRKDLNDTLRFVIEVALAGARPQLTLLSILPGTPLHRRYAGQLEYDGVHSGFSMIHPTERMRNLIKGDRNTFSSFYHLPNGHISRRTYQFLADLVNNVEHFLPTLVLIREHIRRSVQTADFIGIIENNLDRYQFGEDTPLPELYFLTDSLKNFLQHLIDKGLPTYAWDVFQVDFTKAFMIAKYERWQLSEYANRNHRETVKKPGPEDVIRPLPYWKLIKTDHDIFDYMHDLAGLEGHASFRKGCSHYIVLPVSHRMSRLIKVPVAHVQVYKALKESTVGDFIRKNVVILGEDLTRQILGKMIRWGMVEINKVR